MIAEGPPAAQVTDALAGRSTAAATLGDLPASSRTALSHLANFFNTPVGATAVLTPGAAFHALAPPPARPRDTRGQIGIGPAR